MRFNQGCRQEAKSSASLTAPVLPKRQSLTSPCPSGNCCPVLCISLKKYRGGNGNSGPHLHTSICLIYCRPHRLRRPAQRNCPARGHTHSHTYIHREPFTHTHKNTPTHTNTHTHTHTHSLCGLLELLLCQHRPPLWRRGNQLQREGAREGEAGREGASERREREKREKREFGCGIRGGETRPCGLWVESCSELLHPSHRRLQLAASPRTFPRRKSALGFRV